MKTQDKPGTAVDGEGPLKEAPAKKRKPALYIVGAIVLFAALVEGVRYYQFSSTHTGTDDAYVHSDTIQIAPQVSGTVLQVLVKENDHVTKGQVLVKIDPSTYLQAVQQAQANYDLAVSQENAAKASEGLTQAQGNAKVQSANGVVEQSNAGVSSARADVAKSQAAVEAARAAAAGANANVSNARSAVNGAKAQVQRSKGAVSAATAALQTAKNGVPAAQAALDSAQANQAKADHDFARAQVLSNEGAIAAQQLDAIRAADQEAKAQVASAQQGVSSAHAGIDQAQSNLDSAKAQLSASQAAVVQAQAQVVSTQAAYSAANSGIGEATQVLYESQQNVSNAQGKTGQSLGELSQANTVGQQVLVSESQVKEAHAKVEQANAALAQAKINLAYCTVTAPEAGQITNKSISVGSLGQPGAAMMVEVPEEQMWIVANFKETQISGVTPGLRASVDVDGIPDHTFTGTVQSLPMGTGSNFTLLPPDNATGNFTKVVQRVSVKIVLDPNQKDLDLLRAGMSADATITLK
jgi:membrane fusion protein (multidrug efflux system)